MPITAAATERATTTIGRESILEQLNWRYAAKRYDPEKRISPEDWAVLRDSVTLAPSSYGLQPYKIIVVENEKIRRELRDAAYGQPQVTDASHLVVFAYKKEITRADVDNYVTRVARGRGQSAEELLDFREMLVRQADDLRNGKQNEPWGSRQAYIALGFLLETAALLGIDATPMEGFDAAKFDKLLGLEEYSSVVICSLGYRDADLDWLAGQAKIRKSEEELFEVIG